MSRYVRKTQPRAPLTEEQRALASDPAVHAIARKLLDRATRHHRDSLLADEIESELAFAIVSAAVTYDPSKGTRWTTHATVRMYGAVKDAVRSWYGDRRQFVLRSRSLDAPISGDDGDDTHAALLADDAPPVGWELEREDECLAISRRAGSGGGPLLRLLLLRADAGLLREAGAHLGVSESRASQLHATAVDSLRAAHAAGHLDLSGLAEIGGAA